MSKMSALYTRHEILRHDSMRRYTLIGLTHSTIQEKENIVASGFYYANCTNKYYCFSCNAMIDDIGMYSDLMDAHHSSPEICAFVDGRDVSIGDSNSLNPIILGYPKFPNANWFTRKIMKDERDNIFSNFKLRKISRRENNNIFHYLPAVNTPMLIQDLFTTNIHFNVEDFFVTMRSEERRLETFKIENYLFPDQHFSPYLAKLGFIYTLIRKNIQCFACRLVLGNVYNSENLNDYHKKLSPFCALIRGSDVSNEPLIEKPISVTQTDIIEIQCKVCLQNEINVIFNCGHLVLCSVCAVKISSCPTCRAEHTEMRRIYRA